MQADVQMRYFAGVAEAAGVREEMVAVGDDTTVADLCLTVSQAHGPEFARMLSVSALLVDGKRAEGSALLPIRDGLAIDVLPPFAGG